MRAVEAHQKVNADHLKRNAYLYIRQSTLRQVIENTESTKRQYDLRQHAVALGWPVERIVVIDSDLGQSGASAVDREGFQRLVAEVGIGKAGIVLGLEVSRLARNSTDWHRLLEICALTDTLILDEDGVYDPAHYNDRLLLGLKGTLSEAELHVIKARLQGGILNKARRGELESALPVGFIYNPARHPVLDPDKQVQESLRFFFETFTRVGSAMATMKAFHQRGLLFPRRLRKGPQKGDLVWAELTHSRALQILHNPRYAGAFVYGRKRVRKKADGSETCLKRPRDQWILLPGAHPGYISWEEYEENQRRLLENAQAQGDDRRKSPPREGPALLQGLVLCGVCGRRMTVRYHNRCTQPVPDYLCQKDGIEHGKPICQSINGEQIDKAISELLIQTMTPMALDVALAVQEEVQSRLDEVDRLRRKQVERARYEADQAQRRYMHVDPANRLVADTLEAEWNGKLRGLTEAQQEYERLRQTDHLAIDEAQRTRVAALASDFPRLWQDPKTSDRDKKRMVRLLLEDVTLLKGEQVHVHVRFKGGVLKSLSLPLPLSAPYLRKTPAVVVGEVDRLLDQHTEKEIAAILNKKGLRSGMGQPLTYMTVINIRRNYGLRDRLQRMRALGLLTIQEIAARFGIAASAVKDWRDKGLLRAHRYNDKGQCLYEPPAGDLPGKYKKKRPYLVSKGTTRAFVKGVQCEA
jgi:DNA invertase Pin-like site-specific DNA recombinase